MKKIIFGGFFLALISITIVSCTKKVQPNPNTVQSDYFEKIGEYHNDGLDFMLESLKHSLGKGSTKEAWMSELEDLELSLYEFSKSDKTHFVFEKESDSEIVKTMLTGYAKRSTLKSGLNNPYTDIEEYLNETIKHYLAIMESAIDQGSTIEEIVSSLTQIRGTIESQVTREYDLFVLLSTVEVAISSTEYWWVKIIEWRNAFNVDGKVSPQAAARNIAKADLAEAAGGAAYAWIMNMVPGAGQVGYGATIGTVALGASTYEAANTIINWLWP